MKILINGSTLKKGGVLQVGHSLISELMKKSDHDYYYILSSALKKDFKEYTNENNEHFYIYDVKPSAFLSITGKEKRLKAIFTKINADVIFTIYAPSYWKPDCPHVCGYAKASYLYPESPFKKDWSIIKKLRLPILRKLHMHDFKYFNDALVTENEDVSRRLKKLMPSKEIYTVSNTYNQIFDKPEDWDKSIRLPEFKGITLLTISANYKHKNLNIIPDVIAYLRDHYPDFYFRFVLTLKQEELNSLKEEHKEHIIFLGRVSIQQCPYLYEQSDLMFMPTLLECFSATYPEAMKMGVPIVTSDIPFARSICGDAAIYFDPLSAKSIGDTIFNIAMNQSNYSEFISRGKRRLSFFETAESRTQKYIEILEKVYETNHSKSQNG